MCGGGGEGVGGGGGRGRMAFKALLQPANFTLGPDATLVQKYIKFKLITMINKDEYSWLILL